MSDALFVNKFFHGRLREASHRLFWLGLTMVVLGGAAVVFPAMSTLVGTLFVGWVLLISGVITLAGSFSIHGTGPFFGALLLALLSIASAVFLLFNPLAGEIALTLMVGVIFMFQGAFEMFFALDMRPQSGWGSMLASAIASILISVLIVASWPGISLVVLGILFGVNFISTGIGYIAVSRALKPE
jgi:uncharacterized membrane protein HdeD (DUF308 family)